MQRDHPDEMDVRVRQRISVQRVIFGISAGILAAALGAGAFIINRVEPSETTEPSAVLVAHAQRAQRWLIPGSRPAAPAAAAANAPAAMPSLQGAAHGALVDRVTELAKQLAPTGGKLLSAAQYPALRAATAVYTAGACQVSVTVQQLTEPVYLADVTMGFTQDTYQELPDGLQLVTVRHALPHSFQLVAVRGSGVQVTATVTDGQTDVQSDIFTAWSGQDAFVKRVSDLAAAAAVDGFAAP
ncbi:hypothetical protein [Dactylosporangium matsuzakiense]|uniref:Uncharacterized protein n=1 Tax=Dactylosporangium matsuzakiense TaxID=53360 RepID=A0A9W6KP39_9ACTN|nr:hypothetical protein [Dactylosporangium matsuzakiense]UWZ44667.1 hypothetical protein Dmats_46315 [Dactylosporangium matsuzakiense]GLL04687.1 hypothetical protein GCM10017581_064340 [Dactylosporangium matsuzakiense]